MDEPEIIKREDAILRIVNDDINNIRQEVLQDELTWLDKMFREGWFGYDEYSDVALEDVLGHKFDSTDLVVDKRTPATHQQVIRYCEESYRDHTNDDIYMEAKKEIEDARKELYNE